MWISKGKMDATGENFQIQDLSPRPPSDWPPLCFEPKSSEGGGGKALTVADFFGRGIKFVSAMLQPHIYSIFTQNIMAQIFLLSELWARTVFWNSRYASRGYQVDFGVKTPHVRRLMSVNKGAVTLWMVLVKDGMRFCNMTARKSLWELCRWK